MSETFQVPSDTQKHLVRHRQELSPPDVVFWCVEESTVAELKPFLQQDGQACRCEVFQSFSAVETRITQGFSGILLVDVSVDFQSVADQVKHLGHLSESLQVLVIQEGQDWSVIQKALTPQTFFALDKPIDSSLLGIMLSQMTEKLAVMSVCREKSLILDQEVFARKKAHNASFRQAISQNVLNKILTQSLQNISLSVLMNRVLKVVSESGLLSLSHKSTVYLLEDNVLKLQASQNFGQGVEARNHLELDECVCGKNLKFGRVIYVSTDDDGYLGCYEKLVSESVYCLPLMDEETSLGVMTLHMEKDHVRDEEKESFLDALANTLANIIVRKQTEARLYRLANYDYLTGLPNRVLFYEQLEVLLAVKEAENSALSLVLVYMDGLEEVNNSMGFHVGNLLISAFSKRLQESLSANDKLARLGSGEFVLASLRQFGEEGLEQSLISLFQSPLQVEGNEIYISLNLGIAPLSEKDDLERVLRHADVALNVAKRQGNNTFCHYTPELDGNLLQRIKIKNQLYHAVERNEFFLTYQPKVAIGSLKIVGMEALIRWDNPEVGIVSPIQFIPLLEETGMINAVGDWVIETACRQNKAWQDAGLDAIPVAVNLSIVQFRQSGLVDRVKAILDETGLSADYLEIEITESLFMEDERSFGETLREFRDMGVKIALDDFGTGYSSLSYLKRFPVDVLKIDRYFIKDLDTNPEDVAFSQAIIKMGHGLGMEVVAEGVETKEHLEILKKQHCDVLQGFLFSKPVTADKFVCMLEDQQKVGRGFVV
jgi:diguanylate cyclase (GGDEF)-like protein